LRGSNREFVTRAVYSGIAAETVREYDRNQDRINGVDRELENLQMQAG